MEKKRTIIWEGEVDIVGEVVHGSGEFDQMGQEKIFFLDRRR